MQSILIFASLGLAFGVTLLLGIEPGVITGLLAYLMGSNALLTREVNKLKTRFDRVINDLPDLLHQMQLKTATTAPTQDTQAAQPKVDDGVAQRMQALDDKLELLLQHMRKAAPQELTPDHISPPSSITEEAPSATMPSVRDIELMRELLLKMAETMASTMKVAETMATHVSAREAEAHHAPQILESPSHTVLQKEPAPTPKEEGVSRRLSIDELRTELDKIAQELSIELGRPKA